MSPSAQKATQTFIRASENFLNRATSFTVVETFFRFCLSGKLSRGAKRPPPPGRRFVCRKSGSSQLVKARLWTFNEIHSFARGCCSSWKFSSLLWNESSIARYDYRFSKQMTRFSAITARRRTGFARRSVENALTSHETSVPYGRSETVRYDPWLIKLNIKRSSNCASLTMFSDVWSDCHRAMRRINVGSQSLLSH